MTKEQVLLEIEKLQRLKNEKFNEEQGIKDIINSIYGATANEFFSLFDINISEAITLQGQEVIKYSENLITDYFLNRWHLDTELHDKMGLTEVRKLYIVPTIYIDTDSVAGDSILNINGIKISIENLFDQFKEYKIDLKGNHIIEPDSINCLNWSDDNKLYQAKVKKIIRHKVTKKKWKIKTSSGKEIIVTNDHSIIIFRDNIQLTVKPSEILKHDKILTVSQ